MKKTTILASLLLATTVSFAQVEVNSAGTVGIGVTPPNDSAKLIMQSASWYGLRLNNTGLSNGSYYPSIKGTGIYVNNTIGGYSSTGSGIAIKNIVSGVSSGATGLSITNSSTGSSAGSCGISCETSSNGGTYGTAYGIRLVTTSTISGSTEAVYGVHSTVSGTNANYTYSGYFTGGKVVVMDGRFGIGTTAPKETFQIGNIWTFHNGDSKCMGRNTAWDYAANVSRRIEAGYTSMIGFSTEGSVQLDVYGTGAANSIPTRTGYLHLIANGSVGIGRTPTLGKLDVAGDIAINGVLKVSSDERLKKNIKDLSEEKDKLYLLEGKSYKKVLPLTKIEDNAIVEETDKTEFFEYGYLAQELQKVFPELVSQDTLGYYAVNYIALIPIIVEALKDQQVQIKDQREAIAELKRECANKETNNVLKSGNASTSEATQEMYLSDIANAETLKLYQNAPNPFNQRTTVKCFLPEQFQKVQLCVYNMQGVQVQCITIVERGNVSIEIEAGALSAGIYSYVLLADGAASETKQMILTK